MEIGGGAMIARSSRLVSRQATVLKLTIPVMAVLAAIRLSFEFWRLLFDTGPKGAIDLRIISSFVVDWFSGQPYTGTYPPASYLLLWPFFGWLSFSVLRWVWAASFVLVAFWLIRILESGSGITTGLETLWLRLFVLSNYAAAVIIGNGQLALHLMPAILAAILLLRGKEGSWKRDLSAFILLMAAMAKPSISVPFFWVAMFTAGSIRVVVACVIAYLGVTFAAASFRPESMIAILQEWQANVSEIDLGYANIHRWSSVLNLEHWSILLSVLLLGILGIWTFSRRHIEIWVLLGVAAIASRIWTYHQLYDDLLILIPIIALIKISRDQNAIEDGLDAIAGTLIMASWAGLLMPGTLLRLPYPVGTPFRVGQTLIWMGMLGFLLYWAERDAMARPVAPVELHPAAELPGQPSVGPGGDRRESSGLCLGT